MTASQSAQPSVKQRGVLLLLLRYCGDWLHSNTWAGKPDHMQQYMFQCTIVWYLGRKNFIYALYLQLVYTQLDIMRSQWSMRHTPSIIVSCIVVSHNVCCITHFCVTHCCIVGCCAAHCCIVHCVLLNTFVSYTTVVLRLRPQPTAECLQHPTYCHKAAQPSLTNETERAYAISAFIWGERARCHGTDETVSYVSSAPSIAHLLISSS